MVGRASQETDCGAQGPGEVRKFKSKEQELVSFQCYVQFVGVHVDLCLRQVGSQNRRKNRPSGGRFSLVFCGEKIMRE